MLSIAICDDDPEYLTKTEELLKQYGEANNLNFAIFTFDNGDRLLEMASRTPFDIIFLDIIMPLLSGMETARELRVHDKNTKIVFLTSSKDFALESYEVKASDYMLKPISYEKLSDTMDAFRRELESMPKTLTVKHNGGYRKVNLADIEVFEAANKKVIIHFVSGESMETSETLHMFENSLQPEDGFFKCHRSYLVNIFKVNNFNSSDIMMKSGMLVPIARRTSKAFKTAYFQMMFKD